MTTNSHMFAVRATTFGAFCAASFFFFLSPSFLLFSASLGITGMLLFQARSPPSILQLCFPAIPSCLSMCVCGRATKACAFPVCVCMHASAQFEGCSCCRSTKPGPCVEMQPPGWAVLSLPTSPAGSRGWSWLVALCLQTDGNGQSREEVGESERWRGERVSLFSLSAALKKTSPPQCVSSRGWSPSHSASRSGHLYCRVCHKVCAHA